MREDHPSSVESQILTKKNLKLSQSKGKNLRYGTQNKGKMTPMQELLEWVRATLPMDLETPQMIEQKIESMIEKLETNKRCKHIKREGESCRLNNNCTYPNCKIETFNTENE